MARTRRLSGVALTILAACALLGTIVPTAAGSTVSRSTPSSAHAGQQSSQPGDYLSLGDSVPFGFSPFPNRDYPVSFPDLVAGSLHLRLVNAACPGETTTRLIGREQPRPRGCDTSARSPHVNYPGSQLEYAISYLRSHPRTGLVTLMVGANDLFASASPQQGLQTVRQNLTVILSAIRHHYRGPLVVVTYYSTDYRNRTFSAITRELNAVIGAEARHVGAAVADGYRAFALVSSVSPRRGDPCAAGLLIHLTRQICDNHPTPLGAAVLALTVDAAFRDEGRR
ncbi:MAG TPA: SGNH/GDSL hydrolase family protein [Frankiaceae bacterium]|nr:SGNH/GDSL hydrolase family protein [Frankiaceae bacterium]